MIARDRPWILEVVDVHERLVGVVHATGCVRLAAKKTLHAYQGLPAFDFYPAFDVYKGVDV